MPGGRLHMDEPQRRALIGLAILFAIYATVLAGLAITR